MATSVITARLEEPTLARLDALAGRTERSRAWLVAKAVGRYVDEELTKLDIIQEGIDDLEQGRSYSQEEMEAWFEARHRSVAAE